MVTSLSCTLRCSTITNLLLALQPLRKILLPQTPRHDGLGWWQLLVRNSGGLWRLTLLFCRGWFLEGRGSRINGASLNSVVLFQFNPTICHQLFSFFRNLLAIILNLKFEFKWFFFRKLHLLKALRHRQLATKLNLASGSRLGGQGAGFAYLCLLGPRATWNLRQCRLWLICIAFTWCVIFIAPNPFILLIRSSNLMDFLPKNKGLIKKLARMTIKYYQLFDYQTYKIKWLPL